MRATADERERVAALFAKLDGGAAGVGRCVAEASAPPVGAFDDLGADSAALIGGVLAALGPGSDRARIEEAIRVVWTVDRIVWLGHLLNRLEEPLSESRRGLSRPAVRRPARSSSPGRTPGRDLPP
jgi:hypothetical protein